MEYEDSPQNNNDYQGSKQYIELVDGNKFIILYILSLGLYSVWWMYKSWKFFQEKEEPNMMPAARAIFGMLWAYPLFERIRKFAVVNGYTSSYSSGFLFIGFFLLNLVSRLPDPLWLITIFAFVFLIQPVRAFNFAIMNSDDYEGEELSRYSARQLAVVVFGIMFWGLILLGLMMGDVQ